MSSQHHYRCEGCGTVHRVLLRDSEIPLQTEFILCTKCDTKFTPHQRIHDK